MTDNPPAFPNIDEVGNFIEPGMDLRDYFAARLMARMLDRFGWAENSSHNEKRKQASKIAFDAYIIADAMLTTRNTLEKTKA